MKPLVWLAAMLGLATGCASPYGTALHPRPKDNVPPRVAVASFENRSGFEGQWQLGSGVADLLVSELVASRHFVVLERQELRSLVDEISRQRAPAFRSEGRIDEGRLDNARYLIRGVITDFSQTSGGSLWMTFRRWFIGSGGYTARVSLTLTIVEIETGMIVDSVQCSGDAKAGNAFAEADYSGVQFGGRLFFQTPLGKATASAVRQGLRRIVRTVPTQRWQPMLAEATGKQLILNGGKARGLRTGGRYLVRGPGRVITDPMTGDVLDVLAGAEVGTVEVVEVRDNIAFAKPLTGNAFTRGQRLEPLPASP